jgi:hypothetical protein
MMIFPPGWAGSGIAGRQEANGFQSKSERRQGD